MTLAKRTVSLLLLSLFLLPEISTAAAPGQASNRVDIMDKLANHYYLDFKPVAKVELPRLLYIDGGLVFYSSTTAALNSGDGWMDEYYYQNVGTKMYKDDGKLAPASYRLVRTDGTYPTLDLSLSSHLIWFMIPGLLVLFIFSRIKRKYRSDAKDGLVPKGPLHNFFEALVIFVRDDIALANIGPEKYLKYTPYLLTAFFMILFMNLFGLMPWGVTSTADVVVTAALAMFTFVITQLAGSRDYWRHVFAMPGIPKFMLVILTPVEILGLFTKPFALTVRLFANMSSGKMLVYSILGMIFIFSELFGATVGVGSSLIWVGFTVFIYAIKVFASFLQAYIFTMFSALYIGIAAADHEHDHSHDGDHEHAHGAAPAHAAVH
jgi:F-type H+-transporting ATPase subunit a